MKSGISLCMIVRNEERFLGDALASVEGVVDEICIVDTGSTDETVAIAERFGARVERVAWAHDFSAARNAALALATRRWILVLDADERLAPGSRDELRALAARPTDGKGRWIWCRNLSDAARMTAASTNAIIRIFPNDPAIRYRGRLHEYVARDGEIYSLAGEKSTIEIIHYGYVPSVMSEREKGRRNLALARAELDDHPGDPAHIYNYAMSAMLAGETALAQEQLERVVALTEAQPRGFRPMTLTTLSGIYYDQGRFNDALATADRCVAMLPSLPDGHYARGRALVALGRLHEARDAFGEAIRQGAAPGTHFLVEDGIPAWKAHNDLAGTLVREKRYAEARRWLDLALENRPAERVLILNRARVCEAMGDEAAALVAFRSALDGFRDEESAIEYVNFVFRHGSPDICATAVEQALPWVGDDYRCAFLTSAAAVMLRAGREPDALRLLERVSAVREDRAATTRIVDQLTQRYALPALRALFDRTAAPLGMTGGRA